MRDKKIYMTVGEHSISPDMTQYSGSMHKPCSMTLFFHDFAYPPPTRIEIFPFIYMEGKPKRPEPLQIYSNWTIEYVRSLSNEELGALVRLTLNKLDEAKQKIEQRR